MLQDYQIKQDQTRQMRFTRSKFRRINSLDLIPEDPSQESLAETSDMDSNAVNKDDRRQLIAQKSTLSISNGMRKVLLFWPNLLLNMIMVLVRFILYIPLSIAAPSFWLSALLWIFLKLVRIPIGLVKWIINSDAVSVQNASSNNKRTILISCGSTIQTLHLARNFYSSGARVVVFEFDGLFGLARFSTAVDKFYVVPRPSLNNVDSYIAALCHIIKKEKPTVYIPVCATSPAYYDALAKPHMELLGCASFIPGLAETTVLDDCLQLYQKCEAQSIPLPPHSLLSSSNDLWNMYDSGFISNFRNILVAVGVQGLIERYKYILPNSRRDFKFNHDISERNQWLLVRDLPGEHYITCTTVKDSRVVANVTCRVDHDTKNLLPVGKMESTNSEISEENQIDKWLKNFFAKIRFQRSINGHISFRLIKCQGTEEFLPFGVRVGVSLPYICYNRSHAQILCRTMKCVHRKQFNLANNNQDESTLATFGASWRWSAIERHSALAALDKREALFAYWDPLPYCAYYHFQLPLESVKMFLQRRRRSTKKLSPRIMPVH
ncbi:uncharacterized protein LOC119682663 [Teleopsis dalmanni]|uniref:uncharacterized protein LOC119682663 n=2 Tax=Teleopsis dalmanni TaxID=139649 RepID=UPI0018CD329C|nr:uncharacterized protein LOC119682663 [Teleopsis dalmanni]